MSNLKKIDKICLRFHIGLSKNIVGIAKIEIKIKFTKKKKLLMYIQIPSLIHILSSSFAKEATGRRSDTISPLCVKNA